MGGMPMKEITEPTKKINVLAESDVVVVGGGPSGIGAALASARNGAKTTLVERFGSLGGLQTQGNNSIFTFVDPELHNGIIQELFTRLEKGGALTNMDSMSLPERSRMKASLLASIGAKKLPKRLVDTEAGYWGRWGYTFDLEYYKYLLETMMQEAGVKILYHAFAADAIREGNSLKGVFIETKEGRRAVLGKVIIDASGEGDIIWKSGAPCMGDEGFPVGPHKGNPGGFLDAFFINGVDMKKFRAFKEAHMPEWGEMYVGKSILSKAIADGAYIKADTCILATNQDVYNTGRIYVMNPIYKVKDGERSWMTETITDCEIDLRKQAWALFRVVKENIPGFEKSYIEKTPVIPLTGNVHRILGDHVLTIADMRAGKAFEDSIAINNMPPDIYEAVGRFGYEILPHDVPYRCLVSKEIDNLMAAGTTISAGAFAGGGLRYCTPSICTGQAAGTAAALATKKGVSPKKLDVKLLQSTLRKQGARVSVKDVPAEAMEPYRFIQKLGLVFKRIQTPDVTEEEIARY
jgi:hypothetical protein